MTRGRWIYGNHPDLNPGWRLHGTNLVLDYDPTDNSGALRGAYMLWINGRQGPSIDHYLAGAMEYVEANEHQLTSDPS